MRSEIYFTTRLPVPIGFRFLHKLEAERIINRQTSLILSQSGKRGVESNRTHHFGDFDFARYWCALLGL